MKRARVQKTQFLVYGACLYLFIVALACATSTQEPRLAQPGTPARVIYVVSHGWHTGVVLKTGDIPATVVWPEIGDFAQNDYIEVGWGDGDYYPAPETSWTMTLKAGFWSGWSVLHVAGFNEPVRKFFAASEVVEVALTDEAFQELCAFIARTHLRSPGNAGAKIRPGLYGNSGFYPAQGKFHAFRNCNTWVAEALAVAGLPMNRFTLSAGSVMAQVRAFSSRSSSDLGRSAKAAAVVRPLEVIECGSHGDDASRVDVPLCIVTRLDFS